MGRIYQEKCCAFVDFLGFKNFISNKEPEVIYDILNTISQAVEGGANHNFTDIKFQLFSDNIFLTAPKTAQGMKDLIEQVFQLSLAALEKGALIRGGITVGRVSQNNDNNIVFGPGLIKAYELESQLAKYPRVIFSKTAMDFIVSENMDDFKTERLTQADDGAWFINIFCKKITDYYGNWETTFKPIIENFLESNIDNPHIFEKIRWFAEYYNSVLYDEVGWFAGIVEKETSGENIKLNTISLPGWK